MSLLSAQTVRRLCLGFLLLAPAILQAELTFETEEIRQTADPFATSISGTFKFTNTGDKPIHVTNITTTCGCTVASQETIGIYQPGQEGELMATLDIGSRTGNQHKVVNVFIDGAEQPQYRLQFATTIPRVLTITPIMARWKSGDEGPQEITLRLDPKHNIKITEVSSSNPSFTAELVTVREQQMYRVRVDRTSSEGTRFGNILIKAVNEEGEEKIYSAYARTSE